MVKKYVKINKRLMDIIATYMDDGVRETVHFELAPCTPEEFLNRYLELAPEFAELLYQEFDIDIDRMKVLVA